MKVFLQLYPFDSFYIADLNAIGGAGNHDFEIKALLNAHPNLSFWIDNGRGLADPRADLQANRKTVIGTESEPTRAYSVPRDVILSLDFKNGQASGHPDWFRNSSLWPQTIIVMTLNRVGGNSGPDFTKLTELSNAFPAKHWVAAGGVRHRRDLQRLADLGISAALLATALHGGHISAEDIAALENAHKAC